MAVVICALTGQAASAQIESMKFAGSGAHATFRSTDLIAGRSVKSSVSVMVAVPDGKPSAGDPTTKPFVAVSVKQIDANTGAAIFEGLRYSNSTDFQVEKGKASAALKAQLKVNSLTGSDRTVNLDLKWTALKPLEKVSQSNSQAEQGHVINERHSAEVRLSQCSGTVTLQGPSGGPLSLNPVPEPRALWHSISTGTRSERPKPGKPGSNDFTAALYETDSDSIPLWAATSITAQATSGTWTGYWTWNAVTMKWFWTWVWVPASTRWGS